MNEFILLVHGKKYKDESPESLKKHMERYYTWMEKLIEKGQFVKGERLSNAGNILLSKEEIITDGPFLESKEAVGGYIIIRAKNLKEATEITKSCPMLAEMPISVRPMFNPDELKV